MLGKTDTDWRTEQREAARRRILDTAWSQAEAEGVGALSLRALARELGMTAPSLYSYFPSKDAIYDAMFAEAWQGLVERMPELPATDLAPRERLVTVIRDYLDYCNESLARYELMSRRPVPGWEPSPEAYRESERSLGGLVELLASIGITEGHHVDLATAVIGGLAAQQMSNDPGGDRWVRLSEEAADMLLAHLKRGTDR